MKKVIMGVLACLFLSTLVGCDDSETQTHTMEFKNLPTDLADCKFYEIYNFYRAIQVVRCPNSSTSATYQSGKTVRHTITTDGDSMNGSR